MGDFQGRQGQGGQAPHPPLVIAPSLQVGQGPQVQLNPDQHKSGQEQEACPTSNDSNKDDGVAHLRNTVRAVFPLAWTRHGGVMRPPRYCVTGTDGSGSGDES